MNALAEKLGPEVLRRRDILLVDDDPEVLRATARLLASVHQVRTADSLASALIEVGRSVPEVVVSDLDMPNGTGADLLTEIADRHPAVRRVLCSGADCRALVHLGVAHAAIEKPAGYVSLLAVIAGECSVKPTEKREDVL